MKKAAIIKTIPYKAILTLPGYTWMSDVKKIDFYLWSIRA